MFKRIFSILSTGLLIFIVWIIIDWYKDKMQGDFTEDEIGEMVQKCMQSSHNYLLGKDENKAREVCQCAVEELMDTYTAEEITELSAIGDDAFHVFLMPLIENCRAVKPVEETPYQEQMNQCLEAFEPRVGRNNAIVFCDCFVPYLIEKYGYDQLHKTDSIIAVEVEKITDCASFIENE